MKIQLIKAPTQNTGMPEHAWYTPLSLIWLANYLLPHGYEVEILDGQLLDLHEILDRISAEILGISFDILSIDAFDAIVHEGKARGCLTVAGGHLATALGFSLLVGNSDLDVVIREDGEEALLGIAECLRRGRSVDASIPNLLFRRKGELLESVVREVDLKKLPLPRRDVGGIHLEDYFSNFQSTKMDIQLPFTYQRPTNTYSHKGCPFRVNGKGCSFCSRVDTRFRPKSATQVYEEYRYLACECHVDHISDFSDSWISTTFLHELATLYETSGPINSTLRVYGDVRLVTSENARIMRNLGVNTVLLGIESGNETILRLNGKPTTRKQILSAVSSLAANNIMVADAYVLGLIGETCESVNDTIELAREIRQICETEISYWNIMTPLPGSHVWKIMLEENGYSKHETAQRDYHIEIETLERRAVSRLCDLGSNGYEYLCSVREEMLDSSNLGSAEFLPATIWRSKT